MAFFGPDKQKFADSRTAGQPCKLDLLDNGDIVAGLYFGIQTMRAGELAQFFFQSGYGYGDAGMSPSVPMNKSEELINL